MANFPPGRVADIYEDGSYNRYEVTQLTGKGAIVRRTTSNSNKPTPTIMTTITEDAKVIGEQGTITKDLMMTLGYGKLIDSVSTSAFVESVRVRVCKRCKTHNPDGTRTCSNVACKGKSFTSFNKKGKKFVKDFPVVSYSYTAAFLILRTEELRSGTVYALARVLASRVFVKEEDIGIAFQGDQTVVYDKHPHSNVVGYLFDHWESILDEAKGFITGCRCNNGCVACCDVIKGQFVKASNKAVTLENIRYLATQKIVDLSSKIVMSDD
jgi:hypothetical protein